MSFLLSNVVFMRSNMGSTAILEMGGKEPERVKEVVMDQVCLPEISFSEKLVGRSCLSEEYCFG